MPGTSKITKPVSFRLPVKDWDVVNEWNQKSKKYDSVNAAIKARAISSIKRDMGRKR
jgi:hypothetical protein